MSDIERKSYEVVQRANFDQIDNALGNIRGDRDFYLNQAQEYVEAQNKSIANQICSMRTMLNNNDRLPKQADEQARDIPNTIEEHLKNLRRCLDRMESGLEVGNDEHSGFIDSVAHMRGIIQQAEWELSQQ